MIQIFPNHAYSIPRLLSRSTISDLSVIWKWDRGTRWQFIYLLSGSSRFPIRIFRKGTPINAWFDNIQAHSVFPQYYYIVCRSPCSSYLKKICALVEIRSCYQLRCFIFCTLDINECNVGVPCQNNGICANTVGSFTCDCSNIQFTGTRCEIRKYSTIKVAFIIRLFIGFKTKHVFLCVPYALIRTKMWQILKVYTSCQHCEKVSIEPV